VAEVAARIPYRIRRRERREKKKRKKRREEFTTENTEKEKWELEDQQPCCLHPLCSSVSLFLSSSYLFFSLPCSFSVLSVFSVVNSFFAFVVVFAVSLCVLCALCG
jgi:hypothetical protein